MNARAAILLASILAFSPTARAVAAGAPAAYDVRVAPLDDLSRELLTGNGYEVRDDGKVWDKITETTVNRDDMPYLLSRLASARRLRALLQINNIITRYDSERHLSPEDKEAVRAIARENWAVFGVAPRGDFRAYFTLQEQEALDKIPARFDFMSPVTMNDPLPESVTQAAPVVPAPASAPPPVPAPVPVQAPLPQSVTQADPAPTVVPAAVVPAAPVVVAPAAVIPAAPVVAPAAPKMIPTLAPLMSMPSLKRESPFAVSTTPVLVAPTVAVAAPEAPVSTAPAALAVAVPAAPAAAAPAVSTAAPAVAASTQPAVATPDVGVLKPWTPPAGSTAAAVAEPVAASTIAAPAAAAPPPPPEPPKPVVIGAPEYEKFVAAGPYSKDGRALLELIGKRAPEYCLPLLRRTVVRAVPQIVVDGTRTGLGLRAGYSYSAADASAPPTVALSAGPVLLEKKKGMFGGRRVSVLPESPEAWTELGSPRPALDAFSGSSPSTMENGEWGAVRVYADGSRRGTYSPTEQASELLEQLLRLGLKREGLEASEYAARRWARTARLMFEARLKDETKQDGFLDPDRRAELRDWLDRPAEADDAAVSSWAGSRVQAFDPRRGPPEAERDFIARARASCGRAALEDALVDASRRRARRVGALESLLDAGAVEPAAAKAAAQAASDEEAAARSRLLASPPACAAPDPARDEGLRKATVLLAESSRAERALREAKAGDARGR